MDSADSVFKDVVDECREDHVGFWVVVKDVRRALPEQTDIFDITLSLVKRLLIEGDVVAGQFRKTGENEWRFDQWEMPVDEMIAKIGREWRCLDRDPDVGEVVWFTAKEDKANQ